MLFDNNVQQAPIIGDKEVEELEIHKYDTNIAKLLQTMEAGNNGAPYGALKPIGPDARVPGADQLVGAGAGAAMDGGGGGLSGLPTSAPLGGSPIAEPALYLGHIAAPASNGPPDTDVNLPQSLDASVNPHAFHAVSNQSICSTFRTLFASLPFSSSFPSLSHFRVEISFFGSIHFAFHFSSH